MITTKTAIRDLNLGMFLLKPLDETCDEFDAKTQKPAVTRTALRKLSLSYQRLRGDLQTRKCFSANQWRAI